MSENEALTIAIALLPDVPLHALSEQGYDESEVDQAVEVLKGMQR